MVTKGNIIEFHPKFYSGEELAKIREDAYAWAKEEQRRCYPKAKVKDIEDLDKCPDKYSVHLAFFVDPNDPANALARVWWPNDGNLVYYKLHNFAEIQANHPDLAEHYLVNGDYAYLKTEKPAVCHTVFPE